MCWSFFYVHLQWIGTGLLSLKENATKVIHMTERSSNVNNLWMNQTWVASHKQSVQELDCSGSGILIHNYSSVNNSVQVGKIISE